MPKKSVLPSSVASKYRSDKDNVLRGTFNVLPNCMFRAKALYDIQGLGIYSGIYYATKVTHSISRGSYKVVIEAVYKGASALSDGGGGGDVPEEAAPRREEQKIVVDSNSSEGTGFKVYGFDGKVEG
jgi:hypothetical protein